MKILMLSFHEKQKGEKSVFPSFLLNCVVKSYDSDYNARLDSENKSGYRVGVRVVVLQNRVSAASTTARWSSRVDSTEHPESRSYLSENSGVTGPLLDRESSIIPPRGTGLFANLQNT